MHLEGNKLLSGPLTLKAREGETSPGTMRLDQSTALLRVGNGTFPVTETGEFTTQPNGTMVQRDEQILIAFGNQWYTPNVVSIRTEQNFQPGQQAIFTVQQPPPISGAIRNSPQALSTKKGGATAILTNGSSQEVHLTHETGKLVVMGANYSTGAVGVADALATPGQAYVLTAVSSSTIEGALQTLGELTEVCVRKDYNVVGAPILGSWKNEQVRFGSVQVSLSEPTEADVYDAYAGIYNDRILGVGLFTGDVTLGQNIQRIVRYTQSPLKLIPVNYAGDVGTYLTNKPALVSGQMFTAPSTGTYTLIVDTELAESNTENFGRIRFTHMVQGNEQVPSFSLIEGEKYVIVFSLTSGQIQVITTPPLSGGTYWHGQINIICPVYISYEVRGPVALECVQTQIIDTREVVDTRREVNTITVTLTPEN